MSDLLDELRKIREEKAAALVSSTLNAHKELSAMRIMLYYHDGSIMEAVGYYRRKEDASDSPSDEGTRPN